LPGEGLRGLAGRGVALGGGHGVLVDGGEEGVDDWIIVDGFALFVHINKFYKHPKKSSRIQDYLRLGFIFTLKRDGDIKIIKAQWYRSIDFILDESFYG
jgi:hypothetical protein